MLMDLAGLPNKFPTADTKKLVGLGSMTFRLGTAIAEF